MRLPESERPPPPPRTPYVPPPSEYTEEEYRIAYENIPDRHVEWLITKKDRDTTTIMDLYDPGVSQIYREHIIRFRYFGATPLSFEAILELGYQKACNFNEALYYPRPIPPIHKEYNIMIGFKHPKIKGIREYEGIKRRIYWRSRPYPLVSALTSALEEWQLFAATNTTMPITDLRRVEIEFRFIL